MKRIATYAVIVVAILALAYSIYPTPSVRVRIDTLPVKDAVRTFSGSGKRAIFVFESVDCTYCRKLQPELDKLHDVTIYTFILPGHSKDAQDAAMAAWCAPNRSLAWRDAMSGVLPVAMPCPSSPALRNLDLARRLKFSATPTLVFASGRSITGFRTADQIEQYLREK